MEVSQLFGRPLAAVCAALVISLNCAVAQPAKEPAKESAKDFEPQEGQAGKDVIWVPTSLGLVYKMLEAANVTSDDYVIDLGSGDGRTVITAAKRGAKAMGIEYNPDMVALSQRNAAKEGVSDRATFMKADLFESDFSQATVITMFLLSDINLRLRPKLLDMKPGTRIVSNTFGMGDWEADANIQASTGCQRYCSGYYWVIPAKVAGTWRLPQGELKLEQKYQKVSGTLKSKSGTAKVSGSLKGDHLTFTAGTMEYTGRVNGNTIEGTFKTTAKQSWRATRGK